jgi:serine/threonine protein kinase
VRQSNILISDEHEACITDFGLSKYLDQSPTSTVNRGNIRWIAPELLRQELTRGDLTPYNEATDIFSLAMTAIEIYTGSPPFYHIRQDYAVVATLSDGGRPNRPVAKGDSHGMDDCLWGITEECWAQEPRRRPSASDFKQRLEARRDERLSIATATVDDLLPIRSPTPVSSGSHDQTFTSYSLPASARSWAQSLRDSLAVPPRDFKPSMEASPHASPHISPQFLASTIPLSTKALPLAFLSRRRHERTLSSTSIRAIGSHTRVS